MDLRYLSKVCSSEGRGRRGSDFWELKVFGCVPGVPLQGVRANIVRELVEKDRGLGRCCGVWCD